MVGPLVDQLAESARSWRHTQHESDGAGELGGCQDGFVRLLLNQCSSCLLESNFDLIFARDDRVHLTLVDIAFDRVG